MQALLHLQHCAASTAGAAAKIKWCATALSNQRFISLGYCQSHSSCFGKCRLEHLELQLPPRHFVIWHCLFFSHCMPKLIPQWTTVSPAVTRLCLQLGLHSHSLCFGSLLCANWHHDGCQQNGMAASTAQLSTKSRCAQYEVLTNDWHRALRLKYYNISRIKVYKRMKNNVGKTWI